MRYEITFWRYGIDYFCHKVRFLGGFENPATKMLKMFSLQQHAVYPPQLYALDQGKKQQKEIKQWPSVYLFNVLLIFIFLERSYCSLYDDRINMVIKICEFDNRNHTKYIQYTSKIELYSVSSVEMN